MNKTAKLYNLVKQTAIVFLLSMAVAGCSPKPSEQEAVGYTSDETPVHVNEEDSIVPILVNDEDSIVPSIVKDDTSFKPIRVQTEDVSIEFPGVIGGKPRSEKEPMCYAPAPGSKKGGEPTIYDEKYEICLGATRIINLDSHGEMTVRIGPQGSLPEKDTTEVYNSLIVKPEDVRAYARVTPRAPDFVIEPAEPKIVPVTSSGTAVSFVLKPQRKGGSSVRALVEFSSTKDFSDIEESQWTNSLSVNVIVKEDERTANEEEEKYKRNKNLLTTFWDYLSDFWEAFVALIFGALLFVIRKFIKKKTGYGEIPGETLTQKTPPTPEIPTQETPSTQEEIDLSEEDYEVIEPEAPSADSQKVSESDDEDDYDD